MQNYTVKFSEGQSTIVGRNQQDAETYAAQVAQSQGLTVKSVKAETPKAQDNGRYGYGYCHYCGMDAVGFGGFDEPACRECGGS